MTQASIAELVESWRPRYLKASREEKTLILNEFVALTGYHRKSAIRLLRNGRKPKHLDRRGRPRIYTPDVKAALLEVWEACGGICSKQLAPFLPEIVAVLKQKGVLKIRPETEKLLLKMSAATIDRLLRTHAPCRRRTAAPLSRAHSSERRSLSEPSPTGMTAAQDSWRWTLWPTAERALRGNISTPCVPWMWPQDGVSWRSFPTEDNRR